MTLPAEPTVSDALDALRSDGFVVIEGLLDPETVRDLRGRVEAILDRERVQAFGHGTTNESGNDHNMLESIWDLSDEERADWLRRIADERAAEFDTPWPVPENEVCINFIHIPTFFDRGRSQRIFNLINKDPAFAPLLEHPTVLALIDAALGPDAVLMDVSVNHVGPGTDSGGWHVDSPMSLMADGFPDYTLAIQSAWMLDGFTADNGATRVVRASHEHLRQPPQGRADLGDEVVLEGPPGTIAMWLAQTWHRHGPNDTEEARCGVVVQYCRAWVKPFVDLRTPMTAEQAARLSPRLRYMMGCGANPPVRG